MRYAPAVGVILNLQRDHKEMTEVAEMFAVLRARSREALVVGEDENLDALAGGALRFGFGPRADLRGHAVELGPSGSRFQVEQVRFSLPVPGRHNVANALAAIAACRALDVPLADMVAPLGSFQGVGRRFQTVGKARGVTVVDDFAHNADKITAALATAKLNAPRVLAVYQPHGYGPTRFLRKDFVDTFSRELRSDDLLWMLEVFYVGGTASRDFSAADIVSEIADRGIKAEFASSRAWLAARIAEEARPVTWSSSWARAIARHRFRSPNCGRARPISLKILAKSIATYAQKLSYDCLSTRGGEGDRSPLPSASRRVGLASVTFESASALNEASAFGHLRVHRS